ncbi:MAG: RDD family protein [Aeromicrobium sp.]|nr:MAG: RDD family protein [Aeromicrobium sp.]
MPKTHTMFELQGKPAGVVTRTMAGAVDYALVWSTIGLGYVGFAVLGFLTDPRRFSWPSFHVSWFAISGFVLMFLYLWFSWATRGKTVGSVLLGTRVVSASGGKLDFVRAGMRAGFVTVFPIGLFTCAITPGSRSLHDIPLATKVVYHYRVDQVADDEVNQDESETGESIDA